MERKKWRIKTFIFITINIIFILSLDYYVYTKTLNRTEMTYRLAFYLTAYILILQLHSIKLLKYILVLVLYTANASEVASYLTTEKSFSYQFFSSIDFKYGYTDQKGIFFLALLATAFVMLFCYITLETIYLDWKYYIFVVIFNNLCLFQYLFIIKVDLFPFQTDDIFIDPNDPFVKSFETFIKSNINVSQPEGVKPKNLITIILESMELQNLGPFNPEYKNLLPFLSNLTNHTTLFMNVTRQPFNSWSIGSLFTVLCNLPLLKDGSIRYDQGHFHLNRHFKCVPDYLKALNYSSFMVIGGQPNIGNYLDFLSLHNYTLMIESVHNAKYDIEVTNWLVNSSFLQDLKNHQPFNLMWYIQDTHIGCFQNYCERENEEGLSSYLNECECTDSYVKKFFDALEKNDLIEKSEIVIHGDHFVMSNSVHNFVEPRSLLVNIASRQYGRIEHQMTFYDMAHLYLSLLNVSYSPRFPFGGNPLLSNHIPTYPRKNEFNYIFNRFRKQMRFRRAMSSSIMNEAQKNG
ncbi:hypothetical protein TRFO_04636 [Tritrichomonas foetus]|uniref:Sulfatase N-terminal domain-containing protein n=1 Tax=Tritrichomonas foetus TaxID=1144522 RepID=A0A1J4KCB4_9EUKA|nr:hypothetical protein TRFO_04636 [Tritrichomonas foetus]|eukprot:OHT09065.1 hypothetical protein TRFO_04636 [Tritrichomonas foetus]